MHQDEIAGAEFPEDIRSVLLKFDRDADAIVSGFRDGLVKMPVPAKVFHYTDDKGLKGILGTGKIWFTDIFSLNDPSELGHSVSLASNILRENADNPVRKLFSEKFDEFRTQGGLQAAAHFFVASFSTRGDDLSQWRAYADDGRGYVLEFNAGLLEGAFVRTDAQHNSAFPIAYKDSELTGLYQRLYHLAAPLIMLPATKKLEAGVLSRYMGRLAMLLTLNVLQLAIFFKHSGYEGEQEYRFFQIFRFDHPVPNVKYRSRPDSLVRYREFDWKAAANAALTRVVLGPASDDTKAASFASDCLRAHYDGTVEIEKSRVPYRSMK